MDFVIGFIAGLIVGAFIGLFVASLASISREQEIREKFNGDPDGSKAVMEDAIEVLKKQRVVRIAQQAPSVSRFDDDTWKADMNRDAEQYKAGE